MRRRQQPENDPLHAHADDDPANNDENNDENNVNHV